MKLYQNKENTYILCCPADINSVTYPISNESFIQKVAVSFSTMWKGCYWMPTIKGYKFVSVERTGMTL